MGIVADIKQARRTKHGVVRMYFVDSGLHKDVKQARTEDTFTHKGDEYTIDPEAFIGEGCFYKTGIVQPLTLHEAKNCYEYAVTSEKYYSIFHNKVLQQLMYVKEKNLLIYIGCGVGAAIVLIVMDIYYTMQALEILKQGMQVAIDQGVVVR